MALEDLSSLLWREHELLDLLLFKAEEKQYIIVSNKTRWLPRVAKEIEVILDQLRGLEVERAAETEAIAAEFGLSANQPEDLPSRSQMLVRAGGVVDTLKGVSGSLDSLWLANRTQIDATVADVNATAATVADLNQAISRASQSGLPAADLCDQRDLLILKLSDAVGATTRPGKDGTVDVYVGGNALVRGSLAETLRVEGATLPDLAAGDPARVSWTRDGSPATPSGVVGGELDALNVAIPTYHARLDATAASIAARVNTLHVAGFDLNGNPGKALFSGGPPVTAANLTVAGATSAPPSSSRPTPPTVSAC